MGEERIPKKILNMRQKCPRSRPKRMSHRWKNHGKTKR
jgi:hypothetical protein